MPNNEETLRALQRLDQGALQLLGDELLTEAFPQLRELRSNGVNSEGKTTKGVPDSYVGNAPSTATHAVEYTTKKDDTQAKVESDLRTVLEACRSVQEVFLVTNRDGVDAASVQVVAGSVPVVLLQGEWLAQRLDQGRHDLRLDYCDIPIGRQTQAGLLRLLARAADEQCMRHNVPPGITPRHRLHTDLLQRCRPGDVVLLDGPVGVGKTAWSLAFVHWLSQSRPAIWLQGVDLPWNVDDPIGSHIARVTYGAAQPDKVIDLGYCLSRWGRELVVLIDGIDEVRDYEELRRALRAFREGTLGKCSTLVLTHRTEGSDAIVGRVRAAIPELASPNPSVPLRCEPLHDHDEVALLERWGVPPERIRRIQTEMPRRFRGRPLFLREAALLSDDDFRGAGARYIISRSLDRIVVAIADRCRVNGAGPSPAGIRASLVELAWKALRLPSGVVTLAEIETLRSASLLTVAGESSVVGEATRHGLLQQHQDGIEFAHAVFQDVLAAEAADAVDDEQLAQVRAELGPHRATILFSRLAAASARPARLLGALETEESRQVLTASTSLGDAAVADDAPFVRAVQALARRLASSFASDVRLAIRQLAELPTRQASDLALAWFDGLSPQEQLRWIDEIADLCLRHARTDRFQLLLWHRGFSWPKDMCWIEPTVVDLIEALPSDARQELVRLASALLERGLDDGTRDRALFLLSLLRADVVTTHLTEVVLSRRLEEWEHRLLIFINTRDAMAVFEKSVSQWLAYATQHSRDEKAWSRVYHSVVMVQNDIRYYAHEELIALAGRWLGATDVETVTFGLGWADFLKSLALLPLAAAATRRFPSRPFTIVSSAVRDAIACAPVSQVIRIYSTADEELRTSIVYGFQGVRAFSADAEAFLLERLDDQPRIARGAASALGFVGGDRAASLLAERVLQEGIARDLLETMVRSLGSLRCPHSVSALAELQEKLISAGTVSDETRNLDCAIVEALREIGTDAAIQVLARNHECAIHRGAATAALASCDSPLAADALRRFIEAQHPSAETVAGWVRFWNQRRGSTTPYIADPVITGAVLDWCRSGTSTRSDAAHLAGACRGDDAVTFLALLAAAPSPEHEALAIDDRRAEDDRHARRVARSFLAERGIERWIVAVVQDCLDQLAQRRGVGDWDVAQLSRFPHDVVRRELAARASVSPSVNLVVLLGCFSDARDRTLLEELERHADPHVADAAHEILIDPARYAG